ncbi:MAG: glycogen/starch/alpha-glucan phosphorylase [Oscillospiraceae bacterium]|jgi:starch phosphorylase|nr:glycogen/starch/alpha-glucan phosphorylase [Oscillospiraceae bacterium]
MEQQTLVTKEDIKRSILGKLQRRNGCSLQEATPSQLYKAVASTIRDQIMSKVLSSRRATRDANGRRLYYLSVEFLIGRSLHANLLNLCATQAYQEAFADLGISLDQVLREEPEPGLGNGGLGRLAACFMDSLATENLPAVGCTIRYEYGLFRQRIVDGQQVELPDNWLEDGNIWEMPVPADSVEVRFGGHLEQDWSGGELKTKLVDYTSVIAVPYDMPVIGFHTDMVNTLRMWHAQSPKTMDLQAFGQGDYARALEGRAFAEVLCKVLYPEDDHFEGKQLRLNQHYFFTSASLQYMIAEYKREYGEDLHRLYEKAVIHINDTHPGFAIPELMRLLVDEEGMGWEEAEYITRRMVAYTNHTIMTEALERWPEDMVKAQFPRIYQILQELNRRQCERLWERFPGEWDRIAHMAILAYGQVHMANLCVECAYSVNGVSQLHGDILKRDTFRDYASLMPDKFRAITNGITHRRWLMLANPRLASLITDAIGDGWRRDAQHLSDLLPMREDAAFREAFARVKRENKLRLSQWLVLSQGKGFDPDFLLDVQAKRLHEYKRQLLNALHLLVLYNRIAEDPTFDMPPRCVIFGAKASPGYRRAKQIIRFINAVGEKIAKHPQASRLLKVIFLENYSVSAAEVLIPATELSEQLSTATKEASGTGNMKFMMNGAMTIGTLDGANVEMDAAVGRENIYIFGARANEVEDIYASGSYQSTTVFENNQEIRRALNQMIDGTLGEPGAFNELYHSLLFGEYGGLADPYLVLKDFGSYSMAQRRVSADYQHFDQWQRMAIANTAASGIFSSDRTIREYNEQIWRLKPAEWSRV